MLPPEIPPAPDVLAVPWYTYAPSVGHTGICTELSGGGFPRGQLVVKQFEGDHWGEEGGIPDPDVADYIVGLHNENLVALRLRSPRPLVPQKGA